MYISMICYLDVALCSPSKVKPSSGTISVILKKVLCFSKMTSPSFQIRRHLMHLCGLCFFFTFCSLWCPSGSITPGQLTRKGRKHSEGSQLSSVRCARELAAPAQAVTLEYIEMPVDRCKEMWSALLGISSKPVLSWSVTLTVVSQRN